MPKRIISHIGSSDVGPYDIESAASSGIGSSIIVSSGVGVQCYVGCSDMLSDME